MKMFFFYINVLMLHSKKCKFYTMGWLMKMCAQVNASSVLFNYTRSKLVSEPPMSNFAIFRPN